MRVSDRVSVRARGGNGDSVAEKVRDIGHKVDSNIMIACSD